MKRMARKLSVKTDAIAAASAATTASATTFDGEAADDVEIEMLPWRFPRTRRIAATAVSMRVGANSDVTAMPSTRVRAKRVSKTPIRCAPLIDPAAAAAALLRALALSGGPLG